jgi:rod shape-determining protein MreC
MYTLLLFLFRIRAFLLFVAVEALCLWIVFSNNNYQSAAFFNSSNEVSGRIMSFTEEVSSYISLGDQNATLAQENAFLRMQMLNIQLNESPLEDTLLSPHKGLEDSTFYLIPAKVVNNSTRNVHNYITINRGRNHGVEPGMGVISSNGVVGKVKDVSANFSTVTSLLHNGVFTSSMLKKSGTIGSTHWDARDAMEARLLYIPRHIEFAIGDTVVTSGFNAVYPPGIMIGTIGKKDIRGDASYFDITLKLSTDFYRINWVYLVGNRLKVEKEELEEFSITRNE